MLCPSYGLLGALLRYEALINRADGGNLTVIYSSESVAPRSTSRPGAIMPLLVILFIVSYGILTMLVFEQGQTIESQRGLIKEMLKDSTQLAAMKDKIARDDGKRGHEKAPAAPSEQKSTQSPNPASGAKGSYKEATPSGPGKSAHTMKQVPGKPAADMEDVRRSTRVI